MSWKATVEPVIQKLPTVEGPTGHVPFRRKMIWTAGVLVLYFFLTNVFLFGLGTGGQDAFGQFRSLLAGGQGTILQLGIGPIVTASIVLQLVVGANVLNIDKSNPRDQAIYQGLQKLLVFGMVVVQALPMVFGGGFLPASTGTAQALGIGIIGVQVLMFLQVVVGGILIFYLDSIISKWGVGSGVGLFIIAGISQQFIGGLISIPGVIGTTWGVIPGWFAMLVGEVDFTVNTLLFGTGQLIPLMTTIAIFAIVVYAESVHVEIPLAHTRTSGARGRYPIKLIYASVLPLILVRALQANLQMIGRLLNSQLGNAMPAWLGVYAGGEPVGGFFWYLSPIRRPQDWMWWLGGTSQEWWQVLLHVGADITFTVIGGAIFAVFWVETADMGPETVAKRIKQSGMQIPGHRTTLHSITRVVERYVPHVTVLGGALVGLLAVLANMLGTIGGVSGTGLLLTVSITYKLYEEIAEEKLRDMHPMLADLMG